MTTAPAFDVATLNRGQLATLYNEYAKKPVKAFSTHGLAVERVLKLAAEQNAVVVRFEDGTVHFATAEQIYDALHDDAEDVSPLSPAVDAALHDVVAGGKSETFGPVDVPALPPAPEGTPEIPALPGSEADADAEVQTEAPAEPAPKATAEAPAKGKAASKAAAAPKADQTGVKRGPAPRISDDDVLLTVAANPKRVGAANHARYALYAVGMRVGDFLDAAVKLQGATRGRWRGDLFWDVDYGFITVGPAPKKEG